MLKQLLLRRPGTLPLAMLLALCSFAAPSLAQWKWRDSDGRITASNLPPPKDVADKDILTRPAPVVRPAQAPAAAASAAPAATAAAKPEKTALEREIEARRSAAEKEQAAKTRADEDRLAGQRAENCQRARSHQAALETGHRIARFNDKGEREVLDDRGRADEMRRAREVINSDCR